MSESSKDLVLLVLNSSNKDDDSLPSMLMPASKCHGMGPPIELLIIEVKREFRSFGKLPDPTDGSTGFANVFPEYCMSSLYGCVS